MTLPIGTVDVQEQQGAYLALTHAAGLLLTQTPAAGSGGRNLAPGGHPITLITHEAPIGKDLIDHMIRADLSDRKERWREQLGVRRLTGDTFEVACLPFFTQGICHREYAGFDLPGAFDAVVLSADVGVRKPDPAIFQIVLDRLGASADECLFIDDSEMNLEAAARLGFTPLLGLDEDVVARRLRELQRLPGGGFKELAGCSEHCSLSARWWSPTPGIVPCLGGIGGGCGTYRVE
ncbi:HAD-IA family hydrolase [Streptomyces sp. NPDC029721]|uniref:HAD-IA family hydrolase n=1 Tax=Streptomyces sp. NPDC029721 TaxID=3157090 RepID=UPI0033F52980